MATVDKQAIITIDPEVQAAIDRVLAGVRDPDRSPPPLPRAELGNHALNRWTENSVCFLARFGLHSS